MKKLLLAALLLPSLGMAFESSVETVRDYDRPSSRSHFSVDVQYTGLRWAGLPIDAPNGPLYSDYGHGGRLAVEYAPLTIIGRLAVGAGLTLYGQRNIDLGGGRYTSLIGVPVDAFASYRAAFSPRQWVVPFAKIGVGAVGIKRTSKTGGPDQTQQVEAVWNYGGGMEFCLSVLTPAESKELYYSAGVTAMYLVAEYNHAQMINRNAMNLSYESYQLGLRFEF